MKNHSIYVVATYALLILASPLIVSSVANAQAVNCPAGYVCTLINSASPNFNTPQSQGFFNAPGSSSTGAPNYTYTQPQTNSSVPAASVSPVSPCYFYSNNLSLGSRGSDVVALQNFLISKGYQLYGATGYFGSQTAAALQSYQATNGINEGGYFGPITRAKLNSSCSVEMPTPQFPWRITNSADLNQDWKIDANELNTFQILYGYRSGTVRTGEYSVSPNVGRDGNIYVAGPGTQTGRTHSGDSNRDWRISLNELTRVIELSNATGGYRIQTGTEDGFAPISTVSNVSLSVVPIGTPTITRANVSAGWASYETFQYTAQFNAQMTAVGADAFVGLPGANFPAVSSGSFSIYKNGAIDYSNYNATVSYSQPSDTATEPNYSSTFVIRQNQTVTVPITISFTVNSPGANTFGVRLNQINWSNSGGKAGTDLSGSGWSTPYVGGPQVGAPYITSVTASQASTGVVTLNVVGSRLNGGTLNRDEVVYIDGQTAYVGIISQSTDGTSLSFSLSSLSAGSHTLKIVNSSGPNVGTSNVVSFSLFANSAASLDITQYKDGVSTSAQAGSNVYVLGVKLTAGAQGFNTSGFQVSADNSSILSNVRLIDGNSVYYPRGQQGINTYDFYFSGSIPAYGNKVYLMKADIPATASGRTRFTLNGLYHSYGSSGTVGGSFFGIASPDFTVSGPNVGSSADIKANGSDSPVAIANGSNAQVSWTSVNTTYCTAAGSTVSLVGGGTWGNNGRLGTSGSVYVTTPASGSSVYFDIQCYKSDGTSVTDRVYLPLAGTSVAQPTVTVLSPNGHETYRVGDTITLRWSTANVPANTSVMFQLSYFLSGGTSRMEDGMMTSYPSATAGTVQWTIPARYGSGYEPGGFRVRAVLTGPNIPSSNPPQDYSDQSFMISSSVPTTSCTDSDGGQNPNVAGLTDGRVNGIGSYFNDSSVGSNGGACSGDSCTGVAEGYCSNGAVANIVMQCSTGYSVSGACANKVISVNPIESQLSVSSTCVAPGTPISVTAWVQGDGITSKILEKDTNSDGVFGEAASWGSGPGTHYFTSNESADYKGTYSLRFLINGQVRNAARVSVSDGCSSSDTSLNAAIWDAINEYLRSNPQ